MINVPSTIGSANGQHTEILRRSLAAIDILRNSDDGQCLKKHREAIAGLVETGNGSRNLSGLILSDTEDHHRAALLHQALLDSGIASSAMTTHFPWHRVVPAQPERPVREATIRLLCLRDGRQSTLVPEMGQILIGRDTGRDIVVASQATGVAPLHCALVLVRRDGEVYWELRDPGSKSGTWLNGINIRAQGAARLRPGDTFVAGDPIRGETFQLLAPAPQEPCGRATVLPITPVDHMGEEEVTAEDIFVVLPADCDPESLQKIVADLAAIADLRQAVLGADCSLQILIDAVDSDTAEPVNGSVNDAIERVQSALGAHPILHRAVRLHAVALSATETGSPAWLRARSLQIADRDGNSTSGAQRNRLARLVYHLNAAVQESEKILRQRRERAQQQEKAMESYQRLEAYLAESRTFLREARERFSQSIPDLLRESITVEKGMKVAKMTKGTSAVEAELGEGALRLFLSPPRTIDRGADRHYTLTTTEGLKRQDAEEAAALGWEAVLSITEELLTQRMREWWADREHEWHSGNPLPAFPSWDTVMLSRVTSPVKTTTVKIPVPPSGLAAIVQDARSKIFAIVMLGLTLVRYIVNPVASLMGSHSGEPGNGPPLLYGLTPQQITDRVGLVLVSVALLGFFFDQVWNGPKKRRDKIRIAIGQLRDKLDAAAAVPLKAQVESAMTSVEKHLMAFVTEGRRRIAFETGVPQSNLPGTVFPVGPRGFEETSRQVQELRDQKERAQQLLNQMDRCFPVTGTHR